MDEELIDYLFETSRKEGFKKNREDFVKYLQSDDELFDYLYGKAQKEGYKKDKAHFAGLVGRTTTAAPVAKTEPAKTEPTTTEPTKTEVVAATTEPAKTEPTVTETVKTEPTATITTETAPTKTEVVAETKVAAEPMAKAEPQITVKEVEAPVKEEPKKELPVSTGLTPITEKTEVKAVETPSDKMVIKSEKKEEEPMQVKEVTEQPKVEVKEVTKEEPKMVIKSEKKVEEAPKFKDKSDYVNLDFKKEYDFEYMKSLDSNHVERKNFKDKQVLRLGTVRKKDGDKMEDLSIGYDKSKNKWFSYDFYNKGKEYDTWEEVKSDKLISFLNNEFKDVTENKQIEAKDFRKLESDYMPDLENKAKIAEFYLKIIPEKSIKPFGDKGPTVYFDEKENEYFTKDKEGRNVIEKGSEKYNQIQNKIVDLASKQPVENNLDCPPGSSDCSNKDDFNESYNFFKSKDRFNAFGYYTQKEGNLATHLDEKVKNYNNQKWGGYEDDLKLLFLNRDLKSDYKSDDPIIKKYKNKVFYIGETPPTSKRFSIYYLDDSNKSYIYDNETKSIMKELDSRVNLATGRKKAWESILVESPEYKEARDAIEFIKYKKIKGNRNTSIPTFNPVPETPEWQKQ